MPTRIATTTAYLLAAAWLTGIMFAVLLIGASAVGMYEAVLIADLVAIVLVVTGWLMMRRRRRPLTPLARRLEVRHRERRGF